MSNEAARLVIENLQMLDDAVSVLNDVSNKILEEIDQYLENSVKDFEEDWFGNYQMSQDEWSWFAPISWKMGSKESVKALAAYHLGWKSKSDTDDQYWLTSFFPTGKDATGFCVILIREHFQNKISMKQMRSFCLKMNQQHPAIEQAGFKFYAEDGHWFLPFQLDAKQVAENYVGDTLEDAFNPIHEALKILLEVHPYFATIIEDAKQTFGFESLEDKEVIRNDA